ncbi:MICOS complex subunit MIC19-like [Littorina saxatilis]|uniref:MICOS complex subunit MIC19 n=1 Tax=Littorina saxatilis TaxID=31220 RepID=A0AAN9BC08_9CAEN
MGGSGSTRRVVVEDNDGGGVVKISDSVVKRIRGQEDFSAAGAGSSSSGSAGAGTGSRPPSFSGYKGTDVAALQDIEAFYMDRLKQLEQQNSELQKITNEQFVKAVQEVEQKFLKHTCAPVCQDLQKRVYECYLANPKQTLNCSVEVRAFSTCVERARQNALLRKG